MALYKFHGSLGATEIESCSDLLALSQARYIAGNADMGIIFRWSEGRWTGITVDQMLYGRNAKANLLGAFGSASAKTLKKAEKIFQRAA